MKEVVYKNMHLPDVTIIAMTSLDFEGHKKALDLSSIGIEWGGSKIIWDQNIKDINDWNKKIIYDLHHYVLTDFALLVHADGFVCNPHKWDQEFLEYDFVGAPWPLPSDDFSYRTPSGRLCRVGNSVSLRSKRLMKLAATREWRSYYGNTNEDGFICCHNREWLEEQGMKFAPLEVAARFSKEHSIPENEGIETFAFHTV